MKKEIKKLKFRKGQEVRIVNCSYCRTYSGESCIGGKGKIILVKGNRYELNTGRERHFPIYEPEELELLSPKPKRVKKEIEVGSYVKVIDCSSDNDCIGKKGRVTGSYGKAWSVDISADHDLWWRTEELKLVKSPKPKKDAIREKKKELLEAIKDHKASMKTEVQTTKAIRATEGSRYLELEFKGEDCVGFDSNLPYKKTREDWSFMGEAIARILKEL